MLKAYSKATICMNDNQTGSYYKNHLMQTRKNAHNNGRYIHLCAALCNNDNQKLFYYNFLQKPN